MSRIPTAQAHAGISAAVSLVIVYINGEKIDEILGKAFILYWSWDSDSFRPRLSRMATRIP